MKFWIQVMKIWRNSLAPLRTEKQAGSSKRGTSIKYKELHPKTLSLKESLYAFLHIHWEWESNPEYYVRRRHQYPKIRVFWDMILCSLSDMYQCTHISTDPIAKLFTVTFQIRAPSKPFSSFFLELHQIWIHSTDATD